MIYKTPIRVRFRDLDANGHVNNAVYATYMEECRVSFLHDLFPDEEMQMPLILAASTYTFRRPILFSQHRDIEARLYIHRLGQSSAHLVQELWSSDGLLLCEGTAVIVHFNYEASQAMPLPQRAREVFLDYSEAASVEGEQSRV